MLAKGLVRMVRRRYGGGYFTILTPPEGATATKRVAFRSQFVHVAVGYPGLKFLPELQEYRTQHNDYRHVVNAYEAHEHVYERLQQYPSHRAGARRRHRRLAGAAAADGRPAAARAPTPDRPPLPHLHQRPQRRQHRQPAQQTSVFMRRRGADGWAYQGFNYPKSVWGGQLKKQMRKLEGEERAKLYKTMGGTNTPYRRYWQKQMKQGRSEGWYQLVVGTVDQMTPKSTPSGDRIVSHVRTPQGVVPIEADFVIDCTGLEADIAEHRLLKDLLEHGGAGRNPVGRLDVDRTFELKGTRVGQRGRCTHRARSRWAATSPASTRSWACRSPPRRSPTTSRAASSASGSGRCARPCSGSSGSAESRSDPMLPTLNGRIQTRIFMLATWRRVLDPGADPDPAAGDPDYQITFVRPGRRDRAGRRSGS